MYFWPASLIPSCLSSCLLLLLLLLFFLLSLSCLFLPTSLHPIVCSHPFLSLPLSVYISTCCISPFLCLSLSLFQLIALSFVSWLRSLSVYINCGSVNPSPKPCSCIPAHNNKYRHVGPIR